MELVNANLSDEERLNDTNHQYSNDYCVKCGHYPEVSMIREDFVKFINELDTRKPEDLKEMLDMLAKLSFENVLMALTQSKMDGNIPDRNTKAEINSFLQVMKGLNELNSKVVLTEKAEYTKEGDISNIFRQIKAQKTE